MKINLGLASLILALAISGCNSTNRERAGASADSTQEAESCGRVEAAADFSMVFFNMMDDMAKDCISGSDVWACNPANYVLAPIAGVVFAPMGFLIGLSSEEAEAHYCGNRPRASPALQPEDPAQEPPTQSATSGATDAAAASQSGAAAPSSDSCVWDSQEYRYQCW